MDDYWYYNSPLQLPLNSKLPDFSEAASNTEVGDIISFVKTELTETSTTINERNLLSASDTSASLHRLYQSLVHASTHLQSSRHAEPIKTITLDLDKNYDLYDTYFKIERYIENSSVAYIKNLLTIFAQQVFVLATAQISFFEIVSGMEGMRQAINYIGGQIPPSGSDIITLSRDSYTLEEASQDVDTTVKIALWRWRIGHAFFAVMLHFSEHHLSLANATGSTVHIKNSGLYFRASTAAMWFSSAFSSKMYLHYVRPSMVSVNAPHGFSGTDNRDFAIWKQTKEAFINVYKSKPSIPRDQFLALLQFANLYFVDMEHHILLANEMVSTSASLKSDKIAADFRRQVTHGAVETLREMLELRKDEFNFLVKLKTND